MALAERPDENPDRCFPTKDEWNSETQSRTENANRMRLFLNIKQLWSKVIDTEKADGKRYDAFLFLRDDTMWLKGFDLNRLLAEGPADLHVPSCDARIPPMHVAEINDHIAAVSREKVDMFGNYFDRLFSAKLDECENGLDLPLRGCNSEMILKWILRKGGIVTLEVGQDMIPFQRGANIETDSGVTQCFHKYCQSQTNQLVDHNIARCNDTHLPGK